MRLFDKITKLPLKTRKLILWIAVIVIGIVLSYFWLRYSVANLKKTWKPGELEEQFKIAELKEKLKEGFPELKRAQSLLKSWSSLQIPPSFLENNSSDMNFPNFQK